MEPDIESKILSLIKDDLVHTKLLNSLDAMGLDPSFYMIQLSTTILTEMGYNEVTCKQHHLHDRYIVWKQIATGQDIASMLQTLDYLALNLYRKILKYMDSNKKGEEKTE